jgi:hypothetical protein
MTNSSNFIEDSTLDAALKAPATGIENDFADQLSASVRSKLSLDEIADIKNQSVFSNLTSFLHGACGFDSDTDIDAVQLKDAQTARIKSFVTTQAATYLENQTVNATNVDNFINLYSALGINPSENKLGEILSNLDDLDFSTQPLNAFASLNNIAKRNALNSCISSINSNRKMQSWLRAFHSVNGVLDASNFLSVAEHLDLIDFSVEPLSLFNLQTPAIVTLLQAITDANHAGKFRTTDNNLRRAINAATFTNTSVKTNLLTASNPSNVSSVSIADFTALESDITNSLNENTDEYRAEAERVIRAEFAGTFADGTALQTLMNNNAVTNFLDAGAINNLAQTAVVRMGLNQSERATFNFSSLANGELRSMIENHSNQMLSSRDLENSTNYSGEDAFRIIAFCLVNNTVDTEFTLNADGSIVVNTNLDNFNNELYSQIYTGLAANTPIDLNDLASSLTATGFVNVFERFTDDQLNNVVLTARPTLGLNLTAVGSTDSSLSNVNADMYNRRISILSGGQTQASVDARANSVLMRSYVVDFAALDGMPATARLNTPEFRARAQELLRGEFTSNASNLQTITDLYYHPLVNEYFNAAERLQLVQTTLIEDYAANHGTMTLPARGFVRDTILAANEAALNMQDVNNGDELNLEQAFRVICLLSTSYEGTGRAPGSVTYSHSGTNPNLTWDAGNQRLTCVDDLDFINEKRQTDWQHYNNNLDRILTGLETHDARVQRLRNTADAAHIRTLCDTRNSTVLNNVVSAVNTALHSTNNMNVANQNIQTRVDALSESDRLSLALSNGIRGELGSEEFERGVYNVVRSYVLSNITAVDNAAFSGEQVGVKEEVYREMMDRYSGENLQNPEVRTRLTNDIANAAMQRRLENIENARQGIRSRIGDFLSTDYNQVQNFFKKYGKIAIGATLLLSGIPAGIGSALASGAWSLASAWASGVAGLSFNTYLFAAGGYLLGKGVSAVAGNTNDPLDASQSVNQRLYNMMSLGRSASVTNTGELRIDSGGDNSQSLRNGIARLKTNFRATRHGIYNSITVNPGTSMSENIVNALDTAFTDANLNAGNLDGFRPDAGLARRSRQGANIANWATFGMPWMAETAVRKLFGK